MLRGDAAVGSVVCKAMDEALHGRGPRQHLVPRQRALKGQAEEEEEGAVGVHGGEVDEHEQKRRNGACTTPALFRYLWHEQSTWPCDDGRRRSEARASVE